MVLQKRHRALRGAQFLPLALGLLCLTLSGAVHAQDGDGMCTSSDKFLTGFLCECVSLMEGNAVFQLCFRCSLACILKVKSHHRMPSRNKDPWLPCSGSQATEVLEENLSVTDNTEEAYADTEGGDSLIDYGEEVGNKEPGEPPLEAWASGMQRDKGP